MCHILTTGKQRKTSNHSSARKLEPVQKDPVLSVFNCCWWLLVSHAWQCVCHAASCLCSFLSAFTPGDEYYSSDQSRERRKKKKQSPHRHKATCTQITQATGTEHQKWTAKASLYQPLPSDSFMLKKKKKKKVASATDSIPTGKIRVSCLLDYMFEHMLGAVWSNLNYNWVAMNIIIFGELEL